MRRTVHQVCMTLGGVAPLLGSPAGACAVRGCALKSVASSLLLLICSGCYSGRSPFEQRMDVLIGHEVSVVIAAWGQPHQTVRCREVQRRWDYKRKDLVRRACAWEEQGMTAYMWTVVSSSYDGRQSTPDVSRLTLPCSVVVVVADNRIHAWEVAPNQQCQDSRAVNAVPVRPDTPDSTGRS